MYQPTLSGVAPSVRAARMRSAGYRLERRRKHADHERQRADGLRQDDAGDGVGKADPEEDVANANADDEAGHDERRKDEDLDRALCPKRNLGERISGGQGED